MRNPYVVCPKCEFYSIYTILSETEESLILLCMCGHLFTAYKKKRLLT